MRKELLGQLVESRLPFNHVHLEHPARYHENLKILPFIRFFEPAGPPGQPIRHGYTNKCLAFFVRTVG